MLPRARPVAHLSLAALLTGAYLLFGFAVLRYGHPHEDAYILFKYALTFSRGFGIAYYPGGPPAEGATDFLWLVGVSALTRLGVPVGLSALFLNACGYALAVAFYLRTLPRGVALALAALALVLPPSLAGYGGFGTTVYATVALLAFWFLVTEKTVALFWLALLLGLIRPDGVILGAGLCLCALALDRSRFFARRNLLHGAGVVAIGATYFLLRARYFGTLLPLPLYVKSHALIAWPSWPDTLDWAGVVVAPVALFIVGAWIATRARPVTPERREREGARVWTDPMRRKRMGVGLLAVFVHVMSFTTGLQTQNFADRFEAPATSILAFLAACAAAVAPSRARRVALGALASVVLYPAAVLLGHAREELFVRNYVDGFAPRLGAILGKEGRIVTSEAGRIAYFTPGPVLDVVGLNTKETALRPPTDALLEAFRGDVFFLHPAGALDEAMIASGPSDRGVFPLSRPLLDYARPWAGFLLGGAAPLYSTFPSDNIFGGATGALGYLLRNQSRYALFGSHFESRFAHFHVVAIRNDHPRFAEILEALKLAHVNVAAPFLETPLGW